MQKGEIQEEDKKNIWQAYKYVSLNITTKRLHSYIDLLKNLLAACPEQEKNDITKLINILTELERDIVINQLRSDSFCKKLCRCLGAIASAFERSHSGTRSYAQYNNQELIY